MSILSDIAEEEIEMEMTPMIDVTFLLLIFFMLTIKFKTLEGKLSAYLPKDVGVNTSEAVPKEKIEISIKVLKEGTRLNVSGPNKGQVWNREGRFEFVGRELEYRVGPWRSRPNDAEGLRKRLKNLFDEDVANFPDPEDRRDVTIDPSKGTVYADVVGVLDAAIEAGFLSITFVGSYED